MLKINCNSSYLRAFFKPIVILFGAIGITFVLYFLMSSLTNQDSVNYSNEELDVLWTYIKKENLPKTYAPPPAMCVDCGGFRRRLPPAPPFDLLPKHSIASGPLIAEKPSNNIDFEFEFAEMDKSDKLNFLKEVCILEECKKVR